MLKLRCSRRPIKTRPWQLQHNQHAPAAGRMLLLTHAWLYSLLALATVTSVVNTEGIPAPLPVSCTGDTFSKQSCLFRDVCLQTTDKAGALIAWLRNSNDEEHLSLLHRHLSVTLQGVYDDILCLGASQPDRGPDSNSSTAVGERNLTSNGTYTFDPSVLRSETDVTVLWRVERSDQDSYGHALVNEAFAMFLVLQNHFGYNIPFQLQLLAAPGSWHPALQHVLTGAVTGSGQLLVDKMKGLPQGVSGFCVELLVVGNGGYLQASRNSLSNSRHSDAHRYNIEPTFFSSANWWNLRRHTLQVHGITESAAVLSTTQPLIVLNDKRYGPRLQPDRRMIENIEQLAHELSARYPAAKVQVVRFRGLSWTEQVRILARTTVFITTQGSSAFRLVFLPAGATCIMLGAPENGTQEWKGFHELDKWFPLTYVRFIRYEVSINSTAEDTLQKIPGVWEPGDPTARYHWWLYNAHVRVNTSRLGPILDKALHQYIDGV